MKYKCCDTSMTYGNTTQEYKCLKCRKICEPKENIIIYNNMNKKYIENLFYKYHSKSINCFLDKNGNNNYILLINHLYTLINKKEHYLKSILDWIDKEYFRDEDPKGHARAKLERLKEYIKTLKENKDKKVEYKKIKQQYIKGKKVSEIAKENNISRQWVYEIIKNK